jgi:hypothetical protein
MTAKRGRSSTTNRPPSNRPGRSAKALSRRVSDLSVPGAHALQERAACVTLPQSLPLTP